MNPQIWWFLARASGIVAWFLLTASVLVGILLPAKLFNNQRPAWLTDLHRWLAALLMVFLGIHLGGLLFDSYIEFGLKDFLIPMATDWKPVPVALGVVAMWLLVIVQLTSLMMKRLPRRLWKWVHITSYPAFFLTSLHGTFAGTDASNALYIVTSSIAVGALVFAAIFRILGGRRKRVRATKGQPSESSREPAKV